MRLLIAFALAGIIIFLQYRIYKRLWNRKLDVKISFDRDILYENETNTMQEVIINRKYLPLPSLQVKFSITRTFLFERQENTSVTDNYYRNEFFTVMPLQKITRTYPFVCSHRGLFYMNNMDMICRSFFMDNKMFDTRKHEASVCVLPALIEHREVPTDVRNLMGDIEKNMHINEDPFTFAGIRDYQPYDSMHSINWKVTARINNLQVNTYNTTFSKKIVLLLNIDANSMMNTHDIYEWSIRIASHLGRYFIQKHIPTALYTNGVDVMNRDEAGALASKNRSPKDAGCPFVDAGADMSHIRTMEIALARLDTNAVAASFTKLMDERIVASKDPVEYIIISNYRKKDVVDKYEALRAAGNSIRFVIPEMETVEIEEEFKTADYTAWMVRNDDKKISDIH